nr:hypothetical protein [Chamaesiphon polymorphus]
MTNIDIPIGQELLLLIVEIDEFKGKWRALNTLAPDRLAALCKIATIESVGSSARKEDYYLALRQTQGTIGSDRSPNWEPWLLFFLRVLQGLIDRT